MLNKKLLKLKQKIIVNDKKIPGNSLTLAQVYLYLYHYFKPYWFRTLVTIFITIPIGALDAAVAYSLKPYVEMLTNPISAINMNLIPFVIVGFALIQGLLIYLSTYLNGWLGFRVMIDIRSDLFKKLHQQDIAYFDKTLSGVIIQRFFQEPLSINTNILQNTKQMLSRLFSTVFLSGLLISISWQLSIIAIGILLLGLIPSATIRKLIKKLTSESYDATAQLLSFFNESIQGIRVVYGFNLQKLQSNQFDNIQKILRRVALKSTQAQGWLSPSMHTILAIGIASIIWLGSSMVVKGNLSTGSFVSFIASMILLYNPIKNLGGSIASLEAAMLSAARVFELMELTPSIQDGLNPKILSYVHTGITLKNVTFHYTPDNPVLKNVSLDFPKGKTVAIVGSSGSGKSTLGSLIPRFYDVIDGCIQVDGVDIREYSTSSLRSQIAIVMQDTFLFDGSIQENLLVGNQYATDIMITHALKQSCLDEFVYSLPDGIHTRIGERGVMLSGGQRQRLAIARALLKDAPIVILDEATSALDNISEVIVQKAIESLIGDRTVIIIAHRLSTIRKADLIIVLEGGKIVEQGTHNQLMEKNQMYANLYQTQYQPQLAAI